MATKHRIIRMSDEHWARLAERFRQAIPPERRPAHARADSDWQISEGLRMIAEDEIKITTLY